jgi:hypothetical protein
VERQDLERIARATLKELGVQSPENFLLHEDQPGQWRIQIRGNRSGPEVLKIRCGKGTTPQWVREQILNQYAG